MMDDLDRARVLNDFHTARAVEAIRTASGSCFRRESALECEDCGETIPEARRRAVPGCTRCVACQGELERRRR
jgi:phage/conjugal plasmid C-4 type zinc finger TraR family protein